MTKSQMNQDANPLVRIRDLSVCFGSADNVLDQVSLDIHKGRTLALVGESGSGKTLCCRSIMRLLPRSAQVISGEILMDRGQGYENLLTLRRNELRALRGADVSMVFQEPMRSLSPLHTIGNQVGEVLSLHTRLSTKEIRARVLESFRRVGFPNPERAFDAYPFELSGGMRQRAMIAMAIIGQPRLLIADEPTTALDVTTQATILGLLKSLQRETGMGLILVTHDLGVVANMADDIAIMEKGRIVEAGPAHLVFPNPQHSYTRRLIAAAPCIPEDPQPKDQRQKTPVLLEMRGVGKTYTMRSGKFWQAPVTYHAIKDLNLTVMRNKTTAIVGESGSGKTTCGRIALGALKADPGGQITYYTDQGNPLDLQDMNNARRLKFQEEAQMVFQDPYSTLNPRKRIIDTLCEPMEIHRIGCPSTRQERAAELMQLVHLKPDMLNRYPHAFSGGQRQRLSIARALMLEPRFLVCDEPTSALDVSVQEQVLTLLEELQEDLSLSYLFISHDLAVVSRLADDVAVVWRGMIVEQGPPHVILHDPKHPYTRALIAAQPEPDVNRPIDLDVVSKGAGASTNWPEEFRIEGTALPPLRYVDTDHLVRAYA